MGLWDYLPLLPILVVAVAGLVYASTKRSLSPPAATLTIVASIITLISLSQPAVMRAMIEGGLNAGLDQASLQVRVSLLSFGWSLLYAIAFGLLVWAVFEGRTAGGGSSRVDEPPQPFAARPQAFCSTCGSPTDAGARFCRSCGQSMIG
jgi:hypothetical protein